MSAAAKLGVSLVALFGMASFGAYLAAPRITDRNAAIKIVRGKVIDSNVGSGVKFDALLPKVEYVVLPTYRLDAVVSATEKDQVTVRTAEDARIYGTFPITFVLDKTDPNFGNIYTEQKVDGEEDITMNLSPYIARLATPAIIDIYKDIKTTDINDDIPGIGKRIADKLQEYLNNYGFTYIKVKSVMPDGVGLSPKANADLEVIVSEQRKLDLQKVQGQVADAALELTSKQAAVTARALSELRKAGVPEDQLVQAYYLQLMRDGDHLGKPNVPGPIPGTGVGAVPSSK